jgi:S1-C subfamily serine protease
LIGINTAIATSSGSYQGYSFAIPVSLVKKVMDDLLEFGKVQRGLLGIQIADMNASLAEELKINRSQGVIINRVNEGSAASVAGLSMHDVIVGIDGHPVTSVSELQELVARNRPGTEIKVDFLRGAATKQLMVKLKNSDGNEMMTKREVRNEWNGALMEDVPFKELAGLQLEGGVRLRNISEGKWQDAGVKEGYIISHIDKIAVDNLEDLNQILDFKKGGILVEGYYPDGQKGVFGIDW